MQFTSDYKTLMVKFGHDTKVKFDNGSVDVDDDTARKLADFAERNPQYGIKAAGGEVPAEDDDPYKGKRAKTLLKEAEERGLTVPEDAERDDIVAVLVADDNAKGDDTDE